MTAPWDAPGPVSPTAAYGDSGADEGNQRSSAWLQVAELASAAGTTTHAVRYYSRRGLLHPERNPENGYRRYRPRDVARIRFIRRAQRLGMSLNDIREILGEADRGHSPCPRVRTILQQRIVANRSELDALNALQDRMELALESWQSLPDGVPDGHQVCHLIETGWEDVADPPGA